MVAAAILFENRGGKAGYRVIRELKDAVTLEMPELTADVDRLRREIEEILVTLGLYPKEAHAMVETWRDSWFEEGTRVFYAVPQATVDSILPLTIAPAPKEIARVFVGRVEVLSPWIEKNIQTALATGDVRIQEKYGRFLQPFMNQITRTRGRLYQSGRAAIFLQSAYAEVQREFDFGLRFAVILPRNPYRGLPVRLSRTGKWKVRCQGGDRELGHRRNFRSGQPDLLRLGESKYDGVVMAEGRASIARAAL